MEYPESGEFFIAGVLYRNGLANKWYNNGAHGLYNLNQQYTSVSGIYGPLDSSDSSAKCEFYFYGDNELIESLECKYGDMPETFEISVSGVKQLKIEIVVKGYTSKFALANVMIQ